VNNQVTVVFDGHPEHTNPFSYSTAVDSPQSQGEIRVIFSDGCSADDKIKLMVEEDLTRKNCVVVSDDKDIFLYARSLGTKVMSVSAFTSARSTRKGVPGQDHGSGEKYISLSRQEKINKELRFFWLKEKQ